MVENYLKRAEERRQTMETEARKTEEQRQKEFDEVCCLLKFKMKYSFSIQLI